MRINREELVTRYDVVFTPDETKVLRAHPDWQHVISVKSSQNNRSPLWGCATLTKTQINAACDVLGVNGREFMEQYAAQRKVDCVHFHTSYFGDSGKATCFDCGAEVTR